MPSKKTTKKQSSVDPKKLFESKEALASQQLDKVREERDELEATLQETRREYHQLQHLCDEAHTRNEELLNRAHEDRNTIKDLEERLRRESVRSGQALDAFENVSVAVHSTGRVVHWLVDMAQDADLTLKPREKK